MKVPDSGMPEQALWQQFFDAEKLMQTLLPLRPLQGDAAEMGAGYGTFTQAALNSIQGTLHAFDIEPELCAQLPLSVAEANRHRLQVHCQDILDLSEQKRLPLTAKSLRFITVFNLLHFPNPTAWLTQLHDLLADNGKLLIIHWRSDIQTPRGPDMALRPSPESIQAWCNVAGFSSSLVIDISESCPWHFAIVAQK